MEFKILNCSAGQELLLPGSILLEIVLAMKPVIITVLLSLFSYHCFLITVLLSLFYYHYFIITVLLSLFYYHCFKSTNPSFNHARTGFMLLNRNCVIHMIFGSSVSQERPSVRCKNIINQNCAEACVEQQHLFSFDLVNKQSIAAGW